MNPITRCSIETIEEVIPQLDEKHYHKDFHQLENKLIRQIIDLVLQTSPKTAKKKLLKVQAALKKTNHVSPNLATLTHALDGAVEAGLAACS